MVLGSNHCGFMKTQFYQFNLIFLFEKVCACQTNNRAQGNKSKAELLFHFYMTLLMTNWEDECGPGILSECCSESID